MPLYFADNMPYAIGAAPYTYAPVTARETTPRIILTVRINDFETQAFVDTGGMMIISPEIATHLGLDLTDADPAPNFLWRRDTLSGVYTRVALTLLADIGYSLDIETMAFVPKLTPNQAWPEDFPCILGMWGCLERLRFAVDPTDETFYFGELGSTS